VRVLHIDVLEWFCSRFTATDLGMLLVHPLGGDSDRSEMEVMRGMVGAMDL
jgi:hypothetical protein